MRDFVTIRIAGCTATVYFAMFFLPAHAQWSLTQLNQPVTENFAGFTAPSTWGTADPAPNQLDSDVWAPNQTELNNSSASTFGLNYILGRGISTGGVTTPGIYAIDTGGGVVGIGPQADDAAWSPGGLTIKLQNDTGSPIEMLRVEWSYLSYNDQVGRRASQLLSSDTDAAGSYIVPNGNGFLTVDAPELSPSWRTIPRDLTFNASILPGDDYYLRWSFSDPTGEPGNGTARDEIGISNLRITPLGTVVSDTFEWTNAVSGHFDTAGNWTNTTGVSAAPPNQGDTANFNEAGTYIVSFNDNRHSDFLNVDAGDVTFLSDSSALRTYSVTSGLGRAEVSGGTLTVGSETNPVFLDVGDSMNIGFVSNGTVTVGGSDSRLDAAGSSHSIGFANSAGALNIVDGATANFGGTLNVGDSPFIAVGTVSVSTQGTLNTGHIDIARNTSAATGTVTVSGPESSIVQTLAGANLNIGSASGGPGSLDVESGGSFTTGSGTTTVNATGTINLSGGVLNATTIDHTNGGAFNFTAGRLSVGSFTGVLTNQGGTLAPGSSAGGTIIAGDYIQQTGAVLEIEIGGTEQATEYDFVGLTGTAQLGGDLEISLLDFTPDAENTFIVLSALSPGSLTGSFNNIVSGQRLATTDGGGSFTVDYGVSSAFPSYQIVLSDFLPAGLPGDYNGNNMIDAADYTAWRDTLSAGGTVLLNDPTPGTVDESDFAYWRAHFGETIGSGAVGGAAAVPEPATWVLLVLGGAAIAVCWRANFLVICGSTGYNLIRPPC